MKISEPAREVEVIHETDVLVIGSGQGAGVAAAMSVRHDSAFDELDIKIIQQELVRQGVRLH